MEGNDNLRGGRLYMKLKCSKNQVQMVSDINGLVYLMIVVKVICINKS